MSSWQTVLQADLRALQDNSRLRKLRLFDGPQGVEMSLDGRLVLNFSSNDYLGLAASETLANAISTGTPRWGVGSGASRLIVGNLAPHRELEHALATWSGAESTLLFSSGYLANVGAISSLARPGDLILSDALNHASIVDGCRLSKATICIYNHLDLIDLENLLLANRRGHRRILVVSESVFSMDGDQLDVAGWHGIAARAGALTLLDEAHAMGSLGPHGKGLGHGIPIDLRLGTLGKAFGCSGAFLCGSQLLIDYMINCCRPFIFSTAPAVSTCLAATAALDLIAAPTGEQLRRRLWSNVEYFHRGATDIGLHVPLSPILPLRILGGCNHRAMEITDQLLARGLYIQGIRPPTVPEGTARLRMTLLAPHEPEHLDRALAALAELRSSFH